MQAKTSPIFYNKYGFYLFIATIFFSCLWVFFFLFFKNSIDLGELDSRPVQTVKSQLVLTEVERASPWLATDNLTKYGATIYKAQCALCHGAKGLGDGTPGLIPPPRNLIEGKWKLGGSSKALFVTLQKGIEGTSMVSFKHLPKQDRWALVHYIRSITKNKVPDDSKELEEFASKTF